MKIGAIFPQTDIGTQPEVLSGYAQAVERMGFDYLLLYDHVLGVDTSRRPEWRISGRLPHYTHESAFHEVFVLMGYLAAYTTHLELATGVLVLPQRQTALVAKQAAEVDILSHGRLRLGVGAGWNDVEFEGLGMSFANRGARSEEQIALLRALWTEESVIRSGRWHSLPGVGINPLPVQRPIPIFLGGTSEAALQRAARVADGCYMPMLARPENGSLARLRHYLEAAGRDPAAMALETEIRAEGCSAHEMVAAMGAWEALGGTHAALSTLVTGPDGYPRPVRRPVEEHLAMLAAFMDAARTS